MATATKPRLEARSRLSYVARCPRMAALALLGAEPRPATEQERRYWIRGKQIGKYVVEQLQAKYGADDVVAEKTIPWPAGLGHADAYIRSEQLLVEAKSRMTMTPTDDDLLQLAAYLRFDEEASHGALILVNPSSLEERALPVFLTDELRDEVDDRVDEVVQAAKTRVLPNCVCDTPSGCRNKQCHYTELAWEGWTPPPPEPLDADAKALVGALYQVEQRVRAMKETAAAEVSERDELRERVRELIEPDREYAADGIRLKLISVKPRETFDVKTAIKAGVLSEELIEPFRKVGSPSYRWQVEGDPNLSSFLAADYGEVPF